MRILKPFHPGILFFLAFLSAPNLRDNPNSGVFALSFSASFSHAGDSIQDGKSDIKFSAKIAPFSGFLLLKSDNPADITDVSVYSFGLRFTPRVFLNMKWSITAGSVGVSGLPARAKNPVSHTHSPEYKFLRTHSYQVFSSGTTKTPSITDTEIGIELFIKSWNFAVYINPFQPQEEPVWLFINKEFSGLPLASSLLVSLFAGTLNTIPSSNSSWLLPQMQVPETRLFFPAGEMVFHNKLLTLSASFFANAGPLRNIKGALSSAVTFHFKYADISAGLFRADREFITLKDSIETVPERYFISSAFTIPVNRKFVKKIDFSLLASYNRCRAEKFAEEDTFCFYTGGVVKISSKYLNGRFSLEKKDNILDTEGRTVFIIPKAGTKIEGKYKVKITDPGTEESLQNIKFSAGLRQTIRKDYVFGVHYGIEKKEKVRVPVHQIDISGSAFLRISGNSANISGRVRIFSDSSPVSATFSLEIYIK